MDSNKRTDKSNLSALGPDASLYENPHVKLAIDNGGASNGKVRSSSLPPVRRTAGGSLELPWKDIVLLANHSKDFTMQTAEEVITSWLMKGNPKDGKAIRQYRSAEKLQLALDASKLSRDQLRELSQFCHMWKCTARAISGPISPECRAMYMRDAAGRLSFGTAEQNLGYLDYFRSARYEFNVSLFTKLKRDEEDAQFRRGGVEVVREILNGVKEDMRQFCGKRNMENSRTLKVLMGLDELRF